MKTFEFVLTGLRCRPDGRLSCELQHLCQPGRLRRGRGWSDGGSGGVHIAEVAVDAVGAGYVVSVVCARRAEDAGGGAVVGVE